VRQTTTVYRSKGQAVAAAISGGVLVVVGCVVFAADLARGADLSVVILTPLTIIPLGLFLVLRCARAGVHTRDDGVSIVNPRRTINLQWSDIQRFVVGPKGFFPRIAIAELRDSRKIGIFGIQGPNPATRPGDGSAESLVDSLNERLDREHARSGVE
jgi:hypothetical protein